MCGCFSWRGSPHHHLISKVFSSAPVCSAHKRLSADFISHLLYFRADLKWTRVSNVALCSAPPAGYFPDCLSVTHLHWTESCTSSVFDCYLVRHLTQNAMHHFHSQCKIPYLYFVIYEGDFYFPHSCLKHTKHLLERMGT